MTTYAGKPTFVDSVLASSSVIVGRVQGEPEVEIERSQGQARAFSIFPVRVERVVMGEALPDIIRVRVAGGRSADVATEPRVRLTTGDLVLLLLAPDYGREKDQFVPCFDAVYPVTAQGVIEVDEETRAALARAGGVGGPTARRTFNLRQVESSIKAIRERAAPKPPQGLSPQIAPGPYPPIRESPLTPTGPQPSEPVQVTRPPRTTEPRASAPRQRPGSVSKPPPPSRRRRKGA